MKVYCRTTRAASIFHDGMVVPSDEEVTSRVIARCARHTWRERADWRLGPGNMLTNCQRCLRLRQLDAAEARSAVERTKNENSPRSDERKPGKGSVGV